MPNPLIGLQNGFNGLFNMFGNGIMPDRVKSAYNAFKMAQNPQAYLQQLAEKNPDVANVIKMCNGQNPEQVFYSLCKQKGVDPNMILNQLR